MPGTKRKIPIEKRETREQRSVAFSKRRKGLFKKAAELCLLSDAHVAVLASPPSDNRNAVYSFGHTSVDNVVDAFLYGRRPNRTEGIASGSISCDARLNSDDCFQRKKSRLGFWWETEGFENCEDCDELRAYIERLQNLKNNVTLRLKNRETQIISLEYPDSALTIQETDTNGGSCQILSETQNDDLAYDDFAYGLHLDDLVIPDLSVETKEDNPRFQETETGGGSHQTFWETENENLANDDSSQWLCLDHHLALPESSVKAKEDSFADVLQVSCHENNINADENASDENYGFFSFSELLNFGSQYEAFL